MVEISEVTNNFAQSISDEDQVTSFLTKEELEAYDSIISYCTNPRSVVRKEALGLMSGLSQNEEFCKFATGKKCAEDDSDETRKSRVSRIVKAVTNEVTETENCTDAVSFLINMSGNSTFNQALVTTNVVGKLIPLFNDTKNMQNSVLALKLLINITRTEEGSRGFVGFDETIKSLHGYNLRKLLIFSRSLLDGLKESNNKPDNEPATNNDQDSRFTRNFECATLILYILRNVTSFHSCIPFLQSTQTMLFQYLSQYFKTVFHEKNFEFLLEEDVYCQKMEIIETFGHILRHIYVNDKAEETLYFSNSDTDHLAIDYVMSFTFPDGEMRREALQLDQEQNNTPEIERSYPKYALEHGTFCMKRDIRECAIYLLISLLKNQRTRCIARDERQMYSAIRIWHLIEPYEPFKNLIQDVVHLLVYSEEELREQDEKQIKNDNHQ